VALPHTGVVHWLYHTDAETLAPIQLPSKRPTHCSASATGVGVALLHTAGCTSREVWHPYNCQASIPHTALPLLLVWGWHCSELVHLMPLPLLQWTQQGQHFAPQHLLTGVASKMQLLLVWGWHCPIGWWGPHPGRGHAMGHCTGGWTVGVGHSWGETRGTIRTCNTKHRQ
jgi:hypothetical protein